MSHIKGFNKPKLYIQNPLFTFPVGENAPHEVNMLVENPKGSFNKYEYVTNTGTIKLDRVLYGYLPYPVEYGLIPQTWDEDEDMLDIMTLSNFPTFPGCLQSVRPIGVMKFVDTGDVDDKILAVPAGDIRFAPVKDIKNLDEHRLDEIAFFFTHYKELQFKYSNKKDGAVKCLGWGDVDEAYEVIEQSIKRYKKKFGKLKFSKK